MWRTSVDGDNYEMSLGQTGFVERRSDEQAILASNFVKRKLSVWYFVVDAEEDER